jgi:hypothetical protein
MSNFKLINPNLQGDIKTTVSAREPLDAAKQIWTNLSKYFANDVPTFAFTIENQSGGSLHHFKVEETKNKDHATFKIESIESKLKGDDLRKFKAKANEAARMHGGKKDKKDKDDSSSSDSSSEAFESLKMYKNFTKRTLQPITYWWYNPNIYDLTSVYIPTFVTPLVQPYIQIDTVGYIVY